MRLHRSTVAVTVGLVLAGVAGAPVTAEPGVRPFAFGLWGDMPYARNRDDPKIPALLDDMNGDRSLAFTVFDGDLKDGSTPCTDDQYTAAVERFDRLSAPAVYVPGDNEWTDCHRKAAGGYDNLERLAHLRRTMFAGEMSFGRRRMRLTHQGAPGREYSENTRWSFGGVVFVGLDIPGSNNNTVSSEAECSDGSVRTAADCAADNAEYEARNKADIDWLRRSLAAARTQRARGVVVVIQADPGFDLPETAANERNLPAYDGYTGFLAALVEETRAFRGQVVLVHGDTHYFKLDQPLVDQAHLLANFTRLETFGSPNVDWVRVRVDPGSRGLFTFQPMIVARPAPP
jgi:hypothetical protein